MKARFFALAALVLGLASCQNDFDGANVGVGGEVDFQLSVNAPELATRAGLDGVTPDGQADLNSAYGAIDYLQANESADALRVDWTDVDLRYVLEVYDVANGAVVGTAPVKDRQVIIVDKYEPVTFELRLVPKRNYRFVVFADFVAQDASDEASFKTQNELGLHHDLGNTLQEITVKRTAENGINNEVTDAYFAFKDVEITNSASNDIVLQRPYGKLRVIATDLHEINLNSNPDAVKVEYTALQPQTLNAVTGEIGAIENTVTTFVSEYNEIYKEAVEGGLQNHFYNAGYDALEGHKYENANGDVRHTHMTLFTDYILATEQQHSVHFTMTVYDDYANNSEIKATTFNTDIPVQRNYLTTVIGNVLTTATEIEVRIDDNFAGEIVVDADIKDQLEEAANKKNYVIDLTGDLIWDTGASHGSTPLIPEGAITETLTINGNGYKLIATGNGVGPIRLANGGKLILNDLTVVDQSESYNEGAWELGYLEFAGELEFNNCEFKNAVMMCGATPNNNTGANATFNGCKFNSGDANQYDVWVSGDNAYFNECTFEGYRGIKVHEAYGSEVKEVVVDKCQFNNLSKKPGMAIGTLNAETKIAIKNSTFTNCQPGDQGLYIYETDTDVTTFDFTQTNNTVTAAIATSEDFATITKADIHTLNIALAGDVTVDVSAHTPSYYFGGENTNVITIDGAKAATAAATGAGDNTYTLTFNHKNSDWNYIRFNNDNAKWVIKNVKLTNTGKNDGPWNRHDISFYNDVELVNVTSDKAIALFADSDLTNVIISDVHPNNSEAYALWIRPLGQTVNIKNCAFLAHESKTTDRGIKIDNQYVDEGEAKVTLNVDGLKVKSQKKAAILVKSKAGANINIKDIDITEVAADKTNAVWVDSNTKQYAGLVTVTGASMVVEGVEPIEGETPEDIQAKLNAAVTVENAIVQLPAGEYTFPKDFAKGVTVICEEGTVFKGSSSLDINGATVMGATFQSGSDDLVGYYSTINGTYKNCVFNGDLKWSKAGDMVVFENCAFNGPDYALHFDSAVANSHVILKNCEVNSEWRVAIGAAVSMFEAIDTKFTVEGFINLWGKAKFTNCAFNKPYYWICSMDYTEYTNCTCEGRALVADDIRIEDTVIKINDEFYVSNNENLKIALEKNASIINLYEDGEYSMPSVAQGKTFAINGKGENTIIKVAQPAGGEMLDGNIDYATVTFNKVRIVTGNKGAGYNNGFTRPASVTYNECIFDGMYSTINNNHTFNKCTFNQSGDLYNVWTWGAKTATFTECTFNCDGKAMLLYGYGPTVLTMTDCVFNDNGGLVDELKAAIEIGNDYGATYELVVNNATVNGFAINPKGTPTNTTLWANKNSMTQDKLNVVVDGVDVF